MTGLRLPVVVTGAGGFLGKRLCLALRNRGIEPVAWSRAAVDLNDSVAVTALLERIRPGTIFHLAAEGVRTPGMEDPGLPARAAAMARTLALAAAPGCVIVSAGSMTEYGFGGVLSENMPCRPSTDYNRAKLASGSALIEVAKVRQVVVVHARLFHLFGPGEPSHRLMPHLLASLRLGRPVPLSDGRQLRDFLHVDDAAEALVELALAPLEPGGALINVGTGEGLALRDVAFWAAASLGADPDLLQFGQRARSPADQDVLIADASALASRIGRPPPVRLGNGMDFVSLMTGTPPPDPRETLRPVTA